MSFRGELREFELPDILQLIASQQKAGWLKVISKGECHFVFFRDGRITSTKNPADESDPLEEFILRKGVLTTDQADRVAAARRKTGLDVQDILVKEGLLSEEDVRELFESMVEQDIFELMSIKSGTYEFETEDRSDPLPEGALSADIGPILMEGARKADEVSEMRKALGPEDGVLVLTPAGRAADAPLDDEKNLLALVNGVRPIDAVIEESGLDRYTATRLLFDSARRGWVRRLRTTGAARAVEEGGEGEFDVRKAVRWLVPVSLLLVASVLFSDPLRSHRRDDLLLGEWRNRAGQLDAVRQRERIRLAIEVYRVKTGGLPVRLDDLVAERILTPDDLEREGRSRWEYAAAPEDGGFVLLPAPPPPADRVD
jgi:hypothetical protein